MIRALLKLILVLSIGATLAAVGGVLAIAWGQHALDQVKGVGPWLGVGVLIVGLVVALIEVARNGSADDDDEDEERQRSPFGI